MAENPQNNTKKLIVLRLLLPISVGPPKDGVHCARDSQHRQDLVLTYERIVFAVIYFRARINSREQP